MIKLASRAGRNNAGNLLNTCYRAARAAVKVTVIKSRWLEYSDMQLVS